MIRLKVNGKEKTFDGDPGMPLLWYLRDVAGLTGTKFGCGMALCGACTVHQNGDAIRSCTTTMQEVSGTEITTIEGIAAIHPSEPKPGSPDRPCIPCRRRGWKFAFRNADTASPDRSCRRSRCSRKTKIPATRKSIPRCRGICADAEPISGFARRSTKLRRAWLPRRRHEDHRQKDR